MTFFVVVAEPAASRYTDVSFIGEAFLTGFYIDFDLNNKPPPVAEEDGGRTLLAQEEEAAELGKAPVRKR